MAFDLYPAVNEDYEFPQSVREANALTPEFRSQVKPMTETQRNNLSGDELWTDRLVFNTTAVRINRWNGSAWVDLSSEPPAVVKVYAGATAPSGHVICNGDVVPRTGIYAALFAVIGTTYNTGGELSTEFRLPNLKSRVPVGVDAGDPSFNNLGETGGEKTHAVTVTEMPSHNHGGATGDDSPDHAHDSAADGGHQHNTFLGDAAYTNSGGSLTKSYSAGPPGDATYGAGAHDHAIGGASVRHQHSVGAQGGGTAMSLMQPYIAMNYIITL